MKCIFAILIFFSFNVVLAIEPENETLDYTIRFGVIEGGKASISTIHKEYEGKDMVFSEMKMQSSGITNSFYTVDNSFSSFISPVTCLPEKAFCKILEKEIDYDDEVRFFQEDSTLFSKQMGWDEGRGEIFDIVSLIYNLRYSGRLKNLQDGDFFEIFFWDINEIYPLKMKFSGSEEIKTKAGRFQCSKIEPVVKKGSDLSKKMPLTIWITNDAKKLPVMIQFNLKVGSVKCELDSILANE
jgi:hypothetical protein